MASTSTEPPAASGSGTSSRRALPGFSGSTVMAFIHWSSAPEECRLRVGRSGAGGVLLPLLLFQQQSVRDVVLVDVRDVLHRFPPDLPGRDHFHVLEPEVRV